MSMEARFPSAIRLLRQVLAKSCKRSELRRRGGNLALCTACAAGGLGAAIVAGE